MYSTWFIWFVVFIIILLIYLSRRKRRKAIARRYLKYKRNPELRRKEVEIMRELVSL